MPRTERPPGHDPVEGLCQARRTGLLFLVSVLGLFLELMLIRWLGTEIRIFAYLQNTVLVVCFMGLGMGCLRSREPFRVRDVFWPLGLLTLLLALPPTRAFLGKITELLTVLGDFVIWSNGVSTNPVQTCLAVAAGLVLTFGLMLLVWGAFVPIGRLVGRLMEDDPRTIRAYSVNVVGGLVGIWLFVALSALDQPPTIWFAAVAALALPLAMVGRPARAWGRDAALLAGVVALAWLAGREPGALEVRWSPYQKLVLSKSDSTQEGIGGIGEYLLTVNNAGYQAMLDLSPAHVASDESRFNPALRGLSQYDLPFLLHPAPKTALIVGAGSGNDAAGALRNGVERVTAVEIDPAIIDLGRRYHPERPYASPKVALVNDDARSYFAGCHGRFDVISFGLLDSHTSTAMTNARLDHYVYTVESLRQARALLAPGGVMTLSFEAQKPFIADRIARALREVFGEEPLCFRIPQSSFGWGGVMFVAGDSGASARRIAGNPRLAAVIDGWKRANPVVLTGTTVVATDDWPYIYLKSPSIPLLHGLLALLLLALFVLGAKKLQIRGLVTGWDRTHWHFFFLGAAFLLLEVQNISKASVVLGNTWIVNAVIISGILAMVLLANLAVSRFPRISPGFAYAALLLICLGLWAVDVARFNALPIVAKGILVAGLTSLPMLFSGMVFIRSFSAVVGKDQALGANLIGALVGGLLQSVTFVVGVRALIVLVAAFYLVAYATRPRPSREVKSDPETPWPHSRATTARSDSVVTG